MDALKSAANVLPVTVGEALSAYLTVEPTTNETAAADEKQNTEKWNNYFAGGLLAGNRRSTRGELQ